MEEAADKNLVVGLGFDAARGYALADQTSPALAGAAGALTDTTMTGERVTELRIHGVSGSNGPTMLEHPQALQVAGDDVAGFFRRWSPDGPGQPSVPWKLEAYSWGGLTEAPLASASWLVLAPFMMYNVAYFMLPPTVAGSEPMVIEGPEPHIRRDRGHQIAHALLRLLALAATIQFVSAAATVTMSTVAWQAADQMNRLLPTWMGWYESWTAGWRVALALVFTGLVVALLWMISVRTASKYEARISVARPKLNEDWMLTQPTFWRGNVLVTRQRSLHVAAAGASVALIAVLPSGHPAVVRWVAIVVAAAVLVAAVVMSTMPLADRYTVTVVNGGKPDAARPGGQMPAGRSADWWCRRVLYAALASLVISAVASGWTEQQHDQHPGALPGLTTFLVVLLLAQGVLLVALGVVVSGLARRARAAGFDRAIRPYLGGNLATLMATLGFTLGGLLTAVINFGVTRLLGTAEPSDVHFMTEPKDALAMPWPVFAFGAAPIGLLAGAIAAGIVLYLRYRRNTRAFSSVAAGGPSPVAATYAGSTAGAPDGNASTGDGDAYKQRRGAIAKAWAVGLLVDDADLATALAVGGSLALVLAAEIIAAVYVITAGPDSKPYEAWHGLAAVVSLIAIAVAGWLVTLLRQDYSDPAKRKTIGALWDVGTFWPRAVHPLAPPCYAERAIPEVVDRIRLLTGHISHDPERRRDAEVPGRAAGPGPHHRPDRAVRPAAADRLQPGFGHRAGRRRPAARRRPARSRPAHAGLPGPATVRTGLPRLLRPAPAHGAGPPARRGPDTRALEEPAPPQRLHRIVHLRRARAQAGQGLPARPHRPAVPGSPRPGPGREPEPAAHPPPLPVLARPAHHRGRAAPGRAAERRAPCSASPARRRRPRPVPRSARHLAQEVPAADRVGHLGLVGEDREDPRAGRGVPRGQRAAVGAGEREVPGHAVIQAGPP